MKETALILLCALALAHGRDFQAGQEATTCNCDPSEALKICQDNYDRTDVLVAHEYCNRFYKCSNGKPYVYDCPSILLYDPVHERCDWPSLVDCGNRPIADKDDSENDSGSDNPPIAPPVDEDSSSNDDDKSKDEDSGIAGGGNCDPSEAPSVCAAADSDGILVAHEKCNKYYICANGKPVARPCPPNLHFDPNTDRCEWPEAVDCGDRIIPDTDDENDSDNDSSENNSGGNESGGDDNGGTCNCNPDEAPSICASPDSSGVLVAHEKCNKFYKCDHGKPVEFKCPKGLLYNPQKEVCDWPSEVDCGDRVTPEPPVDSEDNNSNGNDSDDNESGGNESGGNESGGDDNGGTCNCNPGEAPSICASPDSSGVLVAHEKCNKFYKCDHGKPVEFKCPKGLLYNPLKEVCDWPSEVDCGDRLTPEPPVDSEDNDSNGNDSEDNESGGNESGGNESGGDDNGGTCNCNPGEAPSICASPDSSGVLVAHEKCNKFYKCDHGKPVEFKCPKGLLYNPQKEVCDWPSEVDCGDRVTPEPPVDSEENDSNGNDSEDNESGGNESGGDDNGGTCNCNPGEAPSICAGPDSSGVLVAHEKCNKFYKCDHGKPVEFKCPKGLLYNPQKEVCDWPSEVDCGDRVTPEPPVDSEDNNSNGNDSDDNESGGNESGGNESGGDDNGGTCNCNPGEAPSICASPDSSGVLVAHEKCNKFYKCDHGKPVEFKCPKGLLYNPQKEVCDWPSEVDCGDRVTPEPPVDSEDNDSNGNDSEDNESGGNESGGDDNGGTCNCNPGEAPSICASPDSSGVLVAHEKCNKFYKCDHGKPVEFKCPKGLLYNPQKEVCDWPSEVDCGDRVTPEPPVDSEENDSNGNDSEDNESGGNESGGDDNGGTCNCNPGEAPSICAGPDSSGVLVAHEKCNKFYKCDHGKPVEFKCPKGLLYNPQKEVCDWPSEVDCGDRVTPEPPVDSEDNNSNGNDSDDNESGGNESGGNESGGDDNGGTCNCNPGEAPSICASPDSSGVLVAHEKCNKFYKCDHGKPVEFKCPKGLLYNPQKEVCDWPSEVDCGDRVTPEPPVDSEDNDSNGNDSEDNESGGNESGGDDNGGTCNCNPGEAPSICASPDSSGVLVAHEKCNKFYKCDHGKPVEFKCPKGLLYNPQKEVCDWPSEVDCGDRVTPEPPVDSEDNDSNGNDSEDNESGGNESGGNESGGDDNGGTCNCNPGEAPSICASPDSSGVLVAHEKCNKFYKCDHGKPVEFKCPKGLLYNPQKEVCDWPSEVDCGDRLNPEPPVDSEDNDSNGNDSEDNESGGNESGGNESGGDDNGGTCNCNPGEAPSICASPDSSGVLVAHEKCNKFYKCDHGKPVEFKCPKGLLYNPQKEVCDWPSEVDCGDRLTPEPPVDSEDNDSNGNDSEDNESGGNESGGNESGGDDNGGTCNCNPGEAPSICASPDSSGVLVAHEKCNKFYKCDHGKPVEFKCPKGLLYNPQKEVCDWPSEVDCGDRVTPEPPVDSEDNDSNGNDSEDNESGGNESGGNESGGDDNGGTCNCNPGEAPSICASPDSSGVLVAHEKCNKFYKCDHGKPVEFKCPKGLLYNPQKEVCDWPSEVDCGDRVTPEPPVDSEDNDSNGNDSEDNESGGNESGGNESGGDDNGGTCNCNPGEAPSICARPDSSGVLVAHEKCNKFYKCDHGKPVELKCPKGLLYNPQKEVCDWPSEVDCGDRVTPEPPVDSEDNDSNGNDSEDNESGGNESGGNESGGDDNGGTCNCNPGEAPSICASPDSSGVLVAHEKCNKFYKCDHGKPVPFECPENTFYNPNKERCDWSNKVECGDRDIPDPDVDNNSSDSDIDDNLDNDDSKDDDGSDDNDSVNDDPSQAPAICAKTDSTGILVAHENCNQFYQCFSGKPIALICPPDLFFNPLTNQCDWTRNVDCGDRIKPETDGECACNPKNAPALCSRANSDGKLIAHENCNQFYVCVHGHPLPRFCAANLFYNIEKEECDWPRDVDCSNRTVLSYSSLNKHLESRFRR